MYGYWQIHWMGTVKSQAQPAFPVLSRNTMTSWQK